MGKTGEGKAKLEKLNHVWQAQYQQSKSKGI